MGKYDDEITRLSDEGKTNAEIVKATGRSRQTVREVLKRLRPGRVAERIKPSLFGVDIRPEHRNQHAYKMLLAHERDALEKGNSAIVDQQLEVFREKHENAVHTYNPGTGFYWVPRTEKHGGKLFIAEDEL